MDSVFKPKRLNELPEQVQKDIQSAVEGAKENLEKSGSLMPVAFVFSGDTFGVVGMPFANQSQKETCVAMLKKVIQAKSADRVLTVLESWMLTGKAAQDYEKTDKSLRVSEHPEKIEVVFFSYQTAKDKFVSGVAPIVTREGKKTFDIESIQFSDEGTLGGLFGDLFPPVN